MDVGQVVVKPLVEFAKDSYRLVNRVQACISQDLARRAAEAAEPIYGTNNSLVVALLRFEQSLALYNQWMTETTAEGADPRNVDKVLAMARAVDAFEDKVLPILQGDAQAACVGYDLAVEVAALAMRFISLMPNLAATGLGLLLFPRGGELFPARSEAEDFVLAAMALIPAAAAARRRFTPTGGELVMVHFMDTMVLSGRLRFEKGRRGFRDELLRSWNAPAVVDALRACGALQYGRLTCSIADQQHAARQRADVAAHGLLVCALPGCEKKETTVREFKVCSACRAVAYCSAEHGMLHWTRRHKHECKDLKEAGAKPARGV